MQKITLFFEVNVKRQLSLPKMTIPLRPGGLNRRGLATCAWLDNKALKIKNVKAASRFQLRAQSDAQIAACSLKTKYNRRQIFLPLYRNNSVDRTNFQGGGGRINSENVAKETFMSDLYTLPEPVLTIH